MKRLSSVSFAGSPAWVSGWWSDRWQQEAPEGAVILCCCSLSSTSECSPWIRKESQKIYSGRNRIMLIQIHFHLGWCYCSRCSDVHVNHSWPLELWPQLSYLCPAVSPSTPPQLVTANILPLLALSQRFRGKPGTLFFLTQKSGSHHQQRSENFFWALNLLRSLINSIRVCLKTKTIFLKLIVIQFWAHNYYFPPPSY